MKVQGVCFGNQIGGAAFLGSIATDIVELCFEDNDAKKDEMETLYVAVLQYEDAEDIIVSSMPVFGAFVDSDAEFDDEYVDENVIERIGDLFSKEYHEEIKQDIAKSAFANEINLARRAMDLFKLEKYGDIGKLYGLEADDFGAPDVSYDRV